MAIKDYITAKERKTFKWKQPLWLYKIIGLTIGFTLSILFIKLLGA